MTDHTRKAEKDRATVRAIVAAGRPTPKMMTYLEGLLISCGFAERTQRNAFLSSETQRDIRFLDATLLTFDEVRAMIGKLEDQQKRAQENRFSRETDVDGDKDWNRR